MTETTGAVQESNKPCDWITVKGFRSIACVEKLELKRINVLIGANGAGKSNLVNVFSLLGALAEGQNRLNKYVARTGGADRNLHFGAKTTQGILVELSFGDVVGSHRAYLTATEDDRLFVEYESIGGVRPLIGRDETLLRTQLDKWRVYHFHDMGGGARILRNAYLNDNQFLREDGENIAPFLYLLREKQPQSYERIKRTFRLVAPFFEDFVLEPLAHNEQMIRLGWRHRASDEYFDIATLSDGSLRFLALATLLLQPAQFRTPITLLDEPELGLHPYAITMLCSLIRSASVETRVILATQSPHLVDQFQPEDVVVVDRVNGESQFRRLSAQALEAWLEDYSLGDLWLKNEIGGRPTYEGSVQKDR